MDMLMKKPLEQNSCSKVLTLSEKKLTDLPKLYDTLMVVTNSTRMTSFTMCPGYHSVKVHLHKLNFTLLPSTTVVPQHSILISDFKEFQVISSHPSLVRTYSYPRPQWYPKDAKVMGFIWSIFPEHQFYIKLWFTGNVGILLLCPSYPQNPVFFYAHIIVIIRDGSRNRTFVIL